MFVIPCKNLPQYNFVVTLVSQIRKFHPDEEILVVDSDSDDKSYFDLLKPYNINIADIKNRHYATGAYWYAYEHFKRDFYYLIHDTMYVKDNLDFLKEKELTIFATFNRCGIHNTLCDRYNELTNYSGYQNGPGKGVCGPILFCKRIVLDKLYQNNVHKILPINKAETWGTEGGWGFCLEQEGYDLEKCSLIGDILEHESVGGLSGPYPHNTQWQFPIEKYYIRRP